MSILKSHNLNVVSASLDYQEIQTQNAEESRDGCTKKYTQWYVELVMDHLIFGFRNEKWCKGVELRLLPTQSVLLFLYLRHFNPYMLHTGGYNVMILVITVVITMYISEGTGLFEPVYGVLCLLNDIHKLFSLLQCMHNLDQCLLWSTTIGANWFNLVVMHSHGILESS